MVDEHKESIAFGGESVVKNGPRVNSVKENGGATDMEISSSGLGGGLLTYKRRKNMKAVEDGIDRNGSASQLVEKPMKHLSDVEIHERSDTPGITSNGCLLKHQRNIVLEQICQSLESEGALKKCIQDALAFHPGFVSRSSMKDSVHSCVAGGQCIVHTDSASGDAQGVAKGSVGKISSGSVYEVNNRTVTELCQFTLFDIIISEKFAQLCSFLLQNGLAADKLFDLSPINLRMNERAYESSPMQFHSDVQQIWTKLQRVGMDIVSLAKCLSDKTMSSFQEQVGGSAQNVSEGGRQEFLRQEADMHRTELTEARGERGHTCRHCGNKADGRNGLVCDSCEEIFHISCIEPAVEEIPIRSWYCAKCTEKGIQSPHDNCTACKRLKTSRSHFDDNAENKHLYEGSEELEDIANESAANERDKRLSQCKVCRAEVKNDDDYRICGHSFCPQKFYHVRCLTSKQLISHGPCWYCPSCLCSACFVDQDDDKIVLCDGCDHAYHIYCMQPPRAAIPRGKWFCIKCEDAIQRVRKARHSYENMQNKSRKIKRDDALNKSGGVDMLLNAAKTLNYEENMAAMGLKAK